MNGLRHIVILLGLGILFADPPEEFQYNQSTGNVNRSTSYIIFIQKEELERRELFQEHELLNGCICASFYFHKIHTT